MISVDEALQRVLLCATPRPPIALPLAEAVGLPLSEDVASDIDSPPYDKAMMDGYAVVATDLATGEATLAILEEVTAGQTPIQTVSSGHATRIMTGAPLPNGANAVVMIENCQQLDDNMVRVTQEDVRSGLNILHRATSLAKDQIVCRAGRVVRPVEVALLAEVGRAEVRVVNRPRVAILATGNELVQAGQPLAAGQIRNSNGPMLTAAARACGAIVADLGIARDEPAELKTMISAGLENDVLVLSGGVSAGVLDLVPAALATAGVEQIFHKVRLKPGKPIWFGVQRRGNRDRLVFGLPGNPISSFVCFHLFVRPALCQLAGCSATSATRPARLAASFSHRGDRPTYFPVTLTEHSGDTQATPVDWRGSADICGFANATALAVFPAGEYTLAVGETIDVLPFA